MRLLRLTVTGFGKLVRQEYALGEGLNVIYGPNESGKSTLQTFIRAMLYGLKTPDAKNRRWRPERALYKPWLDAPYGGALEFKAADGRLYRVERSFDDDRIKVYDLVTGNDLTGRFPLDARKECLFAEYFTGMNELVFTNTACIGDIPDAGSEKGRRELAARLANLRESGEEATSVRRATELLEAARRTLVTQVNTATRTLQEAQAAWNEVCEEHEAIRILEMALSELQQQKDACQKQMDEAAMHLLGYRLVALRAKVEQAQRLMGRLDTLRAEAAKLERLADFPIQILDQVKTLATQLATQEENGKALHAKWRKSQQRLAELQAELTCLPGAVLVTKWTENPHLFEQAQHVEERFNEAAGRTRAAAQRMEAAQAELRAAEQIDQRYAALAELPANAPQLLADLVAINSEAGSIKEHLLGIEQRRRQLIDRCDQYLAQVNAVTNVLQRLERFAGLSPEHRQDFEAQVAACLRLAQQLPQLQSNLDALHKELSVLAQAQQVIQATVAKIDHPDQQQVVEININDLQPMEPQLRAVVQGCERLQRAAAQLQQVGLELAALPDLDADQQALLHQVERENPLWQVAEQQLASAQHELAVLQGQERTLDAQLDALTPVAQAGALELAKAEHLHTEEQEVRREAELAAQAADQVVVPAAGKQVLSGVLAVLGGVAALVSLWCGLPVVVTILALLLALTGGYLFRQAYNDRQVCIKQREVWYEKKRSALGKAERLCSQLRGLLNQVNQPSVAAWRTDWQNCAQLQAELDEVLRKQQLAANQLQQAENQMASARDSACKLMQSIGIELEQGCTATQTAAALDNLREQLTKRERLKQEYQAVATTMATERRILAQEKQDLSEQQRNVTQRLDELNNSLNRQLAQLRESAIWVMRYLSPSTRYIPDVDQLKAGILPWDHAATKIYINEFQAYQNALERAISLEQEHGALNALYMNWQAELASAMQRGQALQQRWQLCAEAVAKLPGAMPEAAVATLSWVIKSADEMITYLGELDAVAPSEPLGFKPVEQARAALRSAVDLTSGISLLDDLITTTDTCSQTILRQAQVTSLEHLAALWHEWEKHQQLMQERRVARDHSRQAFIEERQQLQQLLEQQIAPLCQIAAVATPEVPLATAADLTRLTAILALWQPVINTLATRVQAVATAHAAWQVELKQEADYAAQYAEQQQVHEAMQLKLTTLLHQGGAQTVDEFLAKAADYQSRQQLIYDAQAVQRELQAHLGGQPLAAYQNELAAAQEEWDHLAAAESADGLPDYAQAQAESDWWVKYQQWEEELTVLRKKQMQLEAELTTHQQKCANEAEVAGALQKAMEEKERTSRSLAAVQLAQHQLSEAVEEVHRQFTPELNAQASALLSQVTEQRYQQVAVSDTLDIRLTDAQYARQVDLNTLSRGTSEQVYLAFRLACVQVIAGTQWRVPIVLDDAFAHYDDARAQQALEILVKLADQAKAQILFFTCRSREWYYLKQKAAQLKRPCNIIQLM